MPAATRIISLNLGSQTIGLAEFRAQPHGGLILLGCGFRELLIDPSGEGMRRPQMAAAVRELMGQMQLKTGSVNYAVPGQSVFARFVKLPAVEEEKIEKIIAFEAQQNVPFPIDEVVWDYQLVGGGADEQIQVVLVAIKSDLLDEINGAVEEAGLRASIVDVATMSLYNAFRYNYSDLGGCSLVVDIGARTTNLLFVESGKIFSRSVPIGGSSITVAIAKEFNEPFSAAEFRKKRDGFVSLGGAYAEPTDPDVARVSKIMRSTMTRLHAELMRSISHYRAQQQGSSPQRLFLCGGSASTAYMREFFQEKLQLPIEFFNSLRNVAVAESAPLKEIAHSGHLLGELVGLALRTTSACPMELSLRPASVVRRQELEKRRPFFVMAAACFIFALLGWGFYYARGAQVARRSTAELQDRINAPMRAAEAKIDNLRKQANSLDSFATPLISAINDRFFWVEVLEDLNARLPKEDIWITDLLPTSGGKPIGVDEKAIAAFGPTPTPAPTSARPGARAEAGPAIDGIFVRGLYLFNPKQQEVVVDYFRNLVGSPFYNLDPNNQARYIKPTTPDNTEWAFPYELRLDLKKPVKLP
ncbi:MAG TPA: type IV pilus assembly protein PilM [Chthoniobacterales bacterium]|nr:type IV pilus assembly protein PilM [Chthoniobacterales bacterium]